jgi:hypothetical protein
MQHSERLKVSWPSHSSIVSLFQAGSEVKTFNQLIATTLVSVSEEGQFGVTGNGQ